MNERLGDFEVLRELGRGGMGIVYEARQVSLNRKVALKVLSGGLGLTGKAVTRFKREAEAAAKLHHTNIVPIYATGEEDGTHFYAMELIEGPSLDKVIKHMRREAECSNQRSGISDQTAEELKRGPVGASERKGKPRSEAPDASTLDEMAETVADAGKSQLRARHSFSGGGANLKSEISDSSTSFGSGSGYFDTVAGMIAEVADGLDYAHKQGVIHRDIKPSNLLLSADGRLHINDFGLARMLEEPGMTLSGEFVGSPLYMSPEQIAAGRTHLDHRTDIYSLGATLYELLTLQPPFSGQSRDQILTQIISKEPKPPRQLNKKVPPDLETICLKAIEKDADRRYPTAGALAEDLRRFVNRFAISARRAGVAQRAMKWARRHPGLAVGATMAVLSLLIASGALLQTKAAGERVKSIERQKALDEALLMGMAGDFHGAEKAIGRAEILGAASGQTRLLRGQLALNRGLASEAILHLKEATNQLPHSVAALAMLMNSLGQLGEGNEAERLIPRLDSLKPETSLDYLMLGSVQGLNPESAMVNLDKGVELGAGPLSRLLRAQAMMSLVPATVEIADARKAIADAEFAVSLLGNNPVALGTCLSAYLWEARLQEGKDEARRRELLALAKTKAEAIATLTNAPSAALSRLDYLDYTGDRVTWERELERGYREYKSSATFGDRYSNLLFGRGEIEKGLEVFNEMAKTFQSFLPCTRPIFVAELTGDLNRALQDYEQLKPSIGVWDAFYKPAHLLLIGQEARALAEMQQAKEQFKTMMAYRNNWYTHFYNFFLGQLDEKELLERAGKSLLSLCEAHYVIGLKKLGRGQKIEAKKHFQESVNTRVYGFVEYLWANCFVQRLEQDPNWPRWISTRENSP